jgi:centrosomal CEP192-like protein/HYDIN/CFA65/VesB family protein
MKNYGSLKGHTEIIRNTARNHSGKATFVNLAILLTTLLFAGSAPNAWATGTLTADPGSLSFGVIKVGQTETKTVRLKNTGTTAVRVSRNTLVGAGYRIVGITFPKTLSEGETVSFSVEFGPTKSGSVSGKLQLLSNASNSTLNVPLSGEGLAAEPGYATVTPLSTPFGDVPVGTKDTEIITVKNTGSTTLSVESVTTSAKGFSISGIKTPMSVEGGAETHFTVAFLPEAAGRVSGSIVVKSTGSDSSVTIAVSGTGMASTRTLSVSPTSMAFGDVDLGSSATREISLKNTGNSNIAISSESIKGTGLSETGMGGAVTLTPGQSATLTVEFAPKSAGTVSGEVTIASNASKESISVPVTGSGVSGSTSSTKTVVLTWKASPSAGVSGYYVYRGNVSGGPYTKLDSSAVTGTSYTDSNVNAGEYYYVVAAINSEGAESAYSVQAAVSVP